MLDKYYQPDLVEEKIYKQWEEDGDFKAPIDSKNKHYSIVIPCLLYTSPSPRDS